MDEKQGWLTPEQKDYLMSLAGRYAAVAVIVGLATLVGYLAAATYVEAYLAAILAILTLRW